jgi:hypothetical protein
MKLFITASCETLQQTARDTPARPEVYAIRQVSEKVNINVVNKKALEASKDFEAPRASSLQIDTYPA